MPSRGNRVPSQFPVDGTPTVLFPLCVPDLPEWRQLVIGNLLTMTYGYFWDKDSGDFDLARSVMKDVVLPAIGLDSSCFCDLVVDCILNDPGTRDALRKAESDSTYGNQDTDLFTGISALDDCNEDTLFGAITEMVKYINRLVEDTFQRIEQFTNAVEVAAAWLQGTVIGLPLSAIAEYVDWLIESVSDEYLAEYDLTLENTYRCDLFCLALDNGCSLTNQQIFDYFANRLTSSVDVTNLTDYFEFFVTGNFPGTQIVDALYASIVGLFVVDEAIEDRIGWFDLSSSYGLSTALALGALTPDSSWAIICDPCQLTWCLNFVSGDGNVSNDASLQPFDVGYAPTTYDALSQLFDAGEPPNNGNAVYGRINFDQSINNTEITNFSGTFKFNAKRDRGGLPEGILWVRDDSDNVIASQSFDGVNTDEVVQFDIDVDTSSVNVVQFIWIVSQNTIGDGTYGRITQLTVRGDGDSDPDYGGTPCP